MIQALWSIVYLVFLSVGTLSVSIAEKSRSLSLGILVTNFVTSLNYRIEAVYFFEELAN